MLDVDNVVSFLLEHGLVQTDWIISGELAIRSAAPQSERQGRGTRGRGIPDQAARRDGAGEPGRWATRRPSTSSASRRKKPAPSWRFFRGWSFEIRPGWFMALVLVEGARSWPPIAWPTLPRRSPSSPVALGHGLGTPHRVFRLPRFAGDPRLAWLAKPLPWIFRSNRRPTPSMLASLSPAGLRVFQILRSEPGVGESLERLSLRLARRDGDPRRYQVRQHPRRPAARGPGSRRCRRLDRGLGVRANRRSGMGPGGGPAR